MKLDMVSSRAGPIAVDGMCTLFGFLNMSMKTLNSGSLASSPGLASASVVVGTFLIRLASLTMAPVSVDRYRTRAQAASGFLAVLDTPRMLPVTYPAPYLSGWVSLTGSGAV